MDANFGTTNNAALRLVIGDKIILSKIKAQSEFVITKISRVKVTSRNSHPEKKLVKHNYNKVSRNNNILQIPSLDWFKDIVPASKKNHCL